MQSMALQVRQKRQDRYHEARMRKAKQQQASLFGPGSVCCRPYLAFHA